MLSNTNEILTTRAISFKIGVMGSAKFTGVVSSKLRTEELELLPACSKQR